MEPTTPGEYLIAARAKKRLTQHALCAGTPFHRSELSKWENDRRPLTLLSAHWMATNLVKLDAVKSYSEALTTLVKLTIERWGDGFEGSAQETKPRSERDQGLRETRAREG